MLFDSVLGPLEKVALTSKRLFSIPISLPGLGGGVSDLPRYMFMGPQGGTENVRIGIFAAIHGDEPAGTFAVAKLLEQLDREPEPAFGYELFVYPICNPTGFLAGTRHSQAGVDLNREFWRDTIHPEVRALESEICALRFDGIIALHADDTSDGLYGFVRGATLTRELLAPALLAASHVCPVNQQAIIDSFEAREGIIESGYAGILSAPPEQHPHPFEIILETPHAAPQHAQEEAMAVGVLSILDSFRRLRAFANNI